MVCLDTSFAIDILRGNEEAREILDLLISNRESISITTISIMELIGGLYSSPKLKKEKEEIMAFVSSLIVLSFDLESSFLAGELELDLIINGQIIQPEDIMIASIAMENNETLITKNTKHFEKISGLKIKSY